MLEVHAIQESQEDNPFETPQADLQKYFAGADLSQVTEEHTSVEQTQQPSTSIQELDCDEHFLEIVSMVKLDNGLAAPYLMSRQNKPYTLVLDLDETLIHFDEERQHKVEQ